LIKENLKLLNSNSKEKIDKETKGLFKRVRSLFDQLREKYKSIKNRIKPEVSNYQAQTPAKGKTTGLNSNQILLQSQIIEDEEINLKNNIIEKNRKINSKVFPSDNFYRKLEMEDPEDNVVLDYNPDSNSFLNKLEDSDFVMEKKNDVQIQKMNKYSEEIKRLTSDIQKKINEQAEDLCKINNYR